MPGYRPIKHYGLLTILVTAVFANSSVLAASGQCSRDIDSGHPKIGLVLGGGGARGFAHIGVLQKLEEMRIPYDVIAGTSMGSIVGGLLATGMESDEIIKVVTDADWNDLFSNKMARNDMSMRRKSDDDLGLFGPKLGIGKDSSLLPTGVVSGQKIIFMFESVTSQRVQTTNFDELPIPYRAIATDIVTGDMIVLGTGDLSLAMRASMSVPGVFDAVPYGDGLLVDGGLVRNLPVDVARNMGADVVIAIDVGTKLSTAKDLKNALAIVYQMSGLLTVGNTNKQIESLTSGDVLIQPELGNEISSSDFDSLDKAIPIGYAATEAVENQLQRYSLSEQAYKAWRQGIERCVSGLPKVQFVNLDNNSRFSDEIINEMITIKPGDPLNTEQIDEDIRQIYGLGFIRLARYHIIEKDGQTGVEFIVTPDDRGEKYIETGLDLRSSKRGTAFNIRAGFLNTALDDRGAEYRAVIQLGEEFGIFTDFYRPLDEGLKYIFNPSASYVRRPLLIFDDRGNARGEVEINELGAAIAFGREFGRSASLFAGYTRFGGHTSVEIGNPDIVDTNFNGAELFLEYRLDMLDNRYLPTKGIFVGLKYSSSIKELGADAAYDQLRFTLLGSHTFGRHNIMLGAQYKTTIDGNAPIYALYTAGGFLNMSGFEFNSLVGQHFGQVLAGYRYDLGFGGLLPGYIGTTLEYGNAASRRSDVFADGILNGSVYFGYSSPLGPIYIGVGWNGDRSALFFLKLGAIIGTSSNGRH